MSERINPGGFGAGVAFGILIMAFVIFFTDPYKIWRDLAVKHHAAEYYLDANNDRRWHWLDEPKKEGDPK